jgi:tetratricopeptide (TPR) repeat protein
MPGAPRRWPIPPLAAGLAVLALAAAALSPVLRAGFVYDDLDYVVGNPAVLGGLSPGGLRWAATAFYSANWHPLTWLSHMADVQLFGLDAARHHLVNLLLHLANAALLGAALARLTGAPWPSLLVAALFAVHPAHVESVAWVSERKDLLSTLCACCALLAWAGYARRGGAARYGAALGWFALGLLAKPMLVTLPVLLLLLDFWPLGRAGAAPLATAGGRRRLAALVGEKAPFLLLALGSGLVTLAAQRSFGAVRTFEQSPPGERVANALVSTVRYLGELLWPRDLAVFYPLEPVPPWQAAAAALLIAALTAAAVRLARRRPYLLVGWLWFLVMLLPVIGLVQVGEQARADRYTYLSYTGLFAALAWLGAEAAPRLRRPAVALGVPAALLLAALAALAHAQARVWLSDETLFRHAIAATERDGRVNHVARAGLGTALSDAGRTAEALPHLEAAVRARPRFALALYNLGNVYQGLARPGDAAAAYRAALAARPGYAEAANNLGNVLSTLGRRAEAVAAYRDAVRARPGYAEAWANLGSEYRLAGEGEAAVAALRTALQLRPDLAVARRELDRALAGAWRAP